MSTYSLVVFNQQIDEILRLANTVDQEAKNIKTSLLQSVYMNLINRFAPQLEKLNSQQSQTFLRELQRIDNPDLNDENFEVSLGKLRELITSLDFDFEKELTSSIKVVMSDFVKKISEDLAPEEIEKLKAVFS